MSAIRNIFRSRSKSRSRGETAPQDNEDVPPVPAQPPAAPQETAAEAPASGPLPLFRPDSKLIVEREAPPELIDGIGGQGYESLPSGEAPQTGTLPLHGNVPVQMPREPAPPGTSAYDNVYEGTSPEKGTYPLHGNAPARYPSERSKTPDRASSRGSYIARRRSGPRVPSTHRRSVPPPGTAVTTDEPAPPTPATQTNTARGVTPTQGGGTYLNYSTRRSHDTPDVPVVPGQLKTGEAVGEAPVNGVVTRHERAVSTISKASTASRTPIADEFSSHSFYNRAGSPEAPTWSEVHGEAPQTPTDTQQFSREVPSQPSDAPYLDDGEEMRGRLTGPTVNAPPPTSRQLPERLSEDMPGGQRALSDQQALPIRSATEEAPEANRSLAIPSQPKDAPWNRPLHTGDSPPLVTPIDETIPESSNISTPQINGFPHPPADGILASGPSVDAAKGIQPEPSRSIDSTTPNGIALNGKERLPFERQLSRDAVQPFVQAEVRDGPVSNVTNRALAVEGASEPPALNGIVDLRNTEDTTVHTKVAPAVTHENVQPTVHHIREEQITREFHTHTVHHRVLPIVDVQVLPPKHYVPHPSGQGYMEVPATAIPGRSEEDHYGVSRNWIIAETVTRETVPMTELPRNFTARSFEPTEGDYKEWIGEDGVRRTEQTWIHPPTIATGAFEAGITLPLQMDEPR